MILIFLLIFSVLSSGLIRFSLQKFLDPIIQFAHSVCIEKISPDSTAQAELKALVCAENFSTLQQSETYISCGLIHLFVVSGAHLVLLEHFINFMTFEKKSPRLFIFSILLFYALMCGMSAPVTRCLIAFSVSAYLSQKNILWAPHLKVLVIGLICLSLNFMWITSLSLQLSWLAAFLVSLNESLFKHKGPLFKQSLFYFILLPTLAYFQIPDLSVILINIIFAPILEFFLFPLALLVWLVSPLHILFDESINFLNVVLRLLEIDYRPQLLELPPSIYFFNWSLILSLHLLCHLHYLHRKKSELHEVF